MNDYRIIKRKHPLYKDRDEFILQKQEYSYMTALSSQTNSSLFWRSIGSFSTLEEAKDKKFFLETGLNPGETIVG